MSHRSRTDGAAIAQPAVHIHQRTQQYPISRPSVQSAMTTSLPYSTGADSSQHTQPRLPRHVPKSRIPRPSAIPRPTAAPVHTTSHPLTSSQPAPISHSRSMPLSGVNRTGGSKLDQGLSARTMHSSQNEHGLRRSEGKLVQRDLTASISDYNSKPRPGAPLVPPPALSASSSLPPRLVPELQALAATIRRPLLTPTSMSTVSSPSTQLSGSPGPWSVSTATTATTSWSSASPSMLYLRRSPAINKWSQTVPIPTALQPDTSKRSSLKEPAPTFDLWSTTTPANEVATPSKKSKKPTTPAPTPPPRSSSVKRSRSRSSSKSEVQPSSTTDESVPPLPNRSQDRALPNHATRQESAAQAYGPQDFSTYHHSLQNALYAPQESQRESFDPPQFSAPSLGDERNTATDQPRLMEAAHIGARSTAPPSPTPTQSSRSRLAKFSRLALFGRSAKNLNQEAEPKPQPRKLQRKGPAAGTGHEGYGKYRRGTKGTISDSSIGGTDSESSVQSSIARPSRSRARTDSIRNNRSSQSDLDDFAATRMRPVTIVGGSGRNSESPEDLRYLGGNTTLSANSTAKQTTVFVDASPALQSSPAHPFLVESPTEMSDTRSPVLQPSPSIGQTIAGQLPDPLLTKDTANIQPYVASWNTSQSSFAPSYVTSTDGGNDMFRVDTASLDQRRKKIRRSKWNIFRRKDPDAGSTITVLERTKTKIADELPVSISDMPVHRPLPYYAMMESEADTSSVDAIGDLLNEAAQYAEADDEDDFDIASPETESLPKERVESILLPSAPQFRRNVNRSRMVQSRDIPYTPTDHVATALQHLQVDQRQSRLPQVGRIPKVVPTTQTRQLNRKSFSRPFTKSEPRTPTAGEWSVEGAEFPFPGQLMFPPSLQFDQEQEAGQQDPIPLPVQTSMGGNSMHLSQNPVVDRQSFTSSSSEGPIRVMGPSLLPPQTAGQMRIRSTTGDDEIWKEYDDLIDHVATARAPKKVSQRLGLDRVGSGEWQSGVRFRQSDALGLSALAKGLAIETSFADVPIIFAPSEVTHDLITEQEVRLRRSRIVSALHSSMEPVSPCSVDDCSQASDDQPESGKEMLTDGSTSTGSSCASPPTIAPTIALPAVPPTHHYENATHMNEVARARNPIKHSELSYASLMISRWLSFGRVLFSPAHNEISRQPGKHILVIDGLGSDDWSLYCAVTYKSEQAYIYDFKEIGHHRRPEIAKQSDAVPPNFRRRETANFCETFKFPDNFFAAIVLRFPPVMADAKLKNIISECRRVLAPGGYLELMLLDLDIVNMGVVTRRALRDLKTKISVANPDVSLRPVIDNVQNVLGEKGFSKLSRCVVGVPVIGKPPSSADSPVSTRSSGSSEPFAFSPSADPRPFGSVGAYTSNGFSLSDLVSDHSDGADAKISKMVSRTARSWWQRCFETGIISDGNLSRSILANRQVLNECKARASSFKLLIAYAHKPARPILDHKRRTMSEPFVTTLIPS